MYIFMISIIVRIERMPGDLTSSNKEILELTQAGALWVQSLIVSMKTIKGMW